MKILRTVVLAAACFASGFFVSKVFCQETKQPSPETERFEKSVEYLDIIRNVYMFIQQRYVEEVDPKILYEGAMRGMMSAMEDPYTVYLDEQDKRGLDDTTNGNFFGVGLSISKAPVSKPDKPAYVDVIAPIEGTPGFKAGIQAGDKLIEIDGQSTIEMSMDEVLSKLRGKEGEPVEVTVLRGKTVTFKRTLIRALIEVPTVESAIINKIGYVRLIQFTPETVVRTKEALELFNANNCNGIVIDLRNNPGGLLNSAAEIADMFIDEGPIVSTKSRLAKETRVEIAHKEKTIVDKKIPIVILINGGSASASEILSGALKDYHRAYLVGERTYGKGSVQQVASLSKNDGIKITVARYYTPSDTNIDKIGIPPDKEILLESKYTDEQTKALLKLSEEDVISKYVEEHPNMDEKQITAYALELQKQCDIELRVLRRLIRVQVYRTKGRLIYDTDFDIQLNAAIDIINSGDFEKLVKSTKTLKELQQEVKAEDKEGK